MTPKQRFKELEKIYHYDEDEALRVVEFIETLCHHHKGSRYAGKPFILDDWQKEDIILPVFGLKEYPGGPRLINQVYIEIPKKNGKTTLMEAVELVHLVADGEPGAEILNCAGDDDQANLLFSGAKKMIQAEPIFTDRLKIKTYHSSIIYKDSYIRRITSKAETKHGPSIHAWIIDELHVFKNAEMYETLLYGGAQRENPIGWMITTAGYDKTSICWDRHEYTRQILGGKIEDPHFWGVIYAAGEKDDPYSPKTWEKANPLYRSSELLRRSIEKASAQAKNDISKLNVFKRLRLNIWTSSDVKWIRPSDWDQCKEKAIIQMPHFLGWDLSSTQDITSLTDLHVDDHGYFNVKWYFWIPEKAAEYYHRKFNVPFEQWSEEGFITIVPGNVVDFSLIEKQIIKIKDDIGHPVVSMFDPYMSIDLALRLQENEGLEVEKCPQGFGLSISNKAINDKIVQGKVRHGGNPVAGWMADNVTIKRTDEDRIKIVKPDRNSHQKVDGIVSFSEAVLGWKKNVILDAHVPVEIWR